MKEYTLIALCSVVAVFIIDKFTRTGILKKKEFWLFLIIIFAFKLLVNGYLTGKGVVIYNPEFFLGMRLGSIPLEDFLFGFSMVALSIIFWELFKKEKT